MVVMYLNNLHVDSTVTEPCILTDMPKTRLEGHL